MSMNSNNARNRGDLRKIFTVPAKRGVDTFTPHGRPHRNRITFIPITILYVCTTARKRRGGPVSATGGFCKRSLPGKGGFPCLLLRGRQGKPGFPAEGGFENKSGKTGASESSSLESARGLALRQNRNTLDSSAVAVSTTDGGFCEAHKRETDTDISVPAGGKMFP